MPRRRRRLLVTLGATVTVLVLVAGGLFGYVEYRYHQIHRIAVAGLAPVASAGATAPPSSSGAPGTSGASSPAGGATRTSSGSSEPPETFLLIGDNCRNCLDGKQTKLFGTAAEDGGGRSDVTMLLRVYPGTSTMRIMSIPRDLWLPIPGTDRENRVDDALNAGPSTLVKTITDDLGIPINHYVELNFDTFQDAVNAIGGLNMEFPTRVYDAYTNLNLPAGCYHLNGLDTLQVVRSRHLFYQDHDGQWRYDPLGDISRIQRDHEFLRVLASAIDAKGLGSPITDNNLLDVAAKDLTIDSGVTLGDLARLALVLAHVDVAKSPQTTLPVDEDNSPNGFVYRGGQYGDVVFPSNAADRPVIDAFLGSAAPTHLAPILPVDVRNAAGIPDAAGRTASALRALGYRVSGVGDADVTSNPVESVVYYGPGHEPQALSLAADLGGAVAVGEDASVAGSGLTLMVGTNLTVAHPAPAALRPTGTSGTSGTAGTSGTSGATGTSGTPHAAGTAGSGHADARSTPPSSTPIGGLTAADPHYPWFDPRGCAAGVTPRTPPHLPRPTGLPAT